MTSEHHIGEDVEHIVEKVKEGLAKRTVRMIVGFVIIAVGIALLPVPVVGPAWILIILGLTMLPFAWAQKATAFIRRHVPGIPESGKIPLKSWIIMGVIVVAFVVLATIFGPKLWDWIRHLF